MTDGFAHTLAYAGSDPFLPERERDDISGSEYAALTEDKDYVRLAELRYLTDKLEADLAGRDDVPDATQGALQGLYMGQDAPVKRAVDAYVEQWLDEHRSTPAENGGGA